MALSRPGAPNRGGDVMGSIYKRGPLWWVQYCRDGQRFRESTRSTVKEDAVRLLRNREGQLGIGLLQEKRAARMMENQGYFVMPTRANLPLIDLVAVPCTSPDSAASGPVRLIQVKVGPSLNGRLREQLLHLADSVRPGARVEFWYYTRQCLVPQIEILGGE
jgi:hypothetical protein